MRKADLIDRLIEMGEDPDDLKGMKKDELEEMYDDYTDTSEMLPNESFEDFCDSYDFD